MLNFNEVQHKKIFQILVIVFLCLVIYIPSLSNGFIWDDDTYLYNSLWLQPGGGLNVIWSLDKLPQYYPLTFTSFWLEHEFWGLNPVGYHAVNMILHILNALLFFWIVQKLYPRAAFASALFFAIHPIQVETVAWVTERKNLLSLLFFLSAFLAFMRADTLKSFRYYGLAVLLFICALLSKSFAVCFVAVPALYEWWKRGSVTRQTILFSIVLLAAAIPSVLLSLYLEYQHCGAHGAAFAMSFPEKIILSGRIIFFYIYKMCLPFNFIFIYPRWSIDIHQGWQWLFPAAAVSVAAILLLNIKRTGRGVPALFAFYLISIFPVLGFLNVYSMQFSFVADHYIYLTTPCLFLLLCTVFISFHDRAGHYLPGLITGKCTILKNIFLCLIAVYLCESSMTRVPDFFNEMTLWQSVLKANPQAGIAYVNLGVIYGQMGRNEEALDLFQKALQTNVRKAAVYNNMGMVYAGMGDKNDAIDAYEKAVSLEPELSKAYLNLSMLYFKYKEYAAALKYYDLAVEFGGHVPAEFSRELQKFRSLKN